jgi:choline-sulfatase
VSRKRNLLLIMSDEHNRKALGAAGHPIVETPTLDRLADAGSLYTNAYSTSPICVPARASVATGRYLFETGFWDNADAYDGSVRSWHHELRDRGHPVVAIGKLHFKDADCDCGFSDVRLPMYIPDGRGDLLGLLRETPRERSAAHKLAGLAGPGESDYTRYDRAIAREAVRWLGNEARRSNDRPWALFVSFVAPHFPLIAPREFFDRYAHADIALPKQYGHSERPVHPALDFFRETFTYDRYFEDPAHVRRAIAAYYGLTTFVDHNIGTVLHALENAGLADTTDVVYTSDHGDNLGARGLWGKSTMYEEAIGVPLIVAGAGYRRRGIQDAAVSHIDLYPFVLEHFGIDDTGSVPSQPPLYRSRSFARDDFAAVTAERPVFAEYHATGSHAAFFMLRHGRHKLVHYVDGPPQFFDLATDPEELVDLAAAPQARPSLERMTALLYAACDPVEVDRRAKKRQAELIMQAGGSEAILARADYGYSPVPPEALA